MKEISVKELFGLIDGFVSDVNKRSESLLLSGDRIIYGNRTQIELDGINLLRSYLMGYTGFADNYD